MEISNEAMGAANSWKISSSHPEQAFSFTLNGHRGSLAPQCLEGLEHALQQFMTMSGGWGSPTDGGTFPMDSLGQLSPNFA